MSLLVLVLVVLLLDRLDLERHQLELRLQLRQQELAPLHEELAGALRIAVVEEEAERQLERAESETERLDDQIVQHLRSHALDGVEVHVDDQDDRLQLVLLLLRLELLLGLVQLLADVGLEVLHDADARLVVIDDTRDEREGTDHEQGDGHEHLVTHFSNPHTFSREGYTGQANLAHARAY